MVDVQILLIDLILQKQKAYSHLLFNTRDNVDFEGIQWKLGVLYLLLDSCKILLIKECKEDWGFSRSFEPPISVLGKVLLGVILSNFAFICTLFISTRILLTSLAEITRLFH
ncbi:arv1-like protein [Thalictrum thalictroides]|uniref:Protein ARV n=1 Tax=Thalictrum thalictroides TaxID=46969 RepID=A0A7J6W2S5_THATH|nr:arv1-like protein [Thalictrum thalictroides]